MNLYIIDAGPWEYLVAAHNPPQAREVLALAIGDVPTSEPEMIDPGTSIEIEAAGSTDVLSAEAWAVGKPRITAAFRRAEA